jgi:small-conductance mechanosensitive channel
MRKILTKGTLLALAVLLVVLIVCFAFAWNSSDAMAQLSFLRQAKTRQPGNGGDAPVDLRPWQTAHVLAGLAVTAEEVEYAREAERLADHEVDQSFALALRQAAAHQRVLTGEALELSQKVTALEGMVKADQAAVEKINAAGANASDDLDIAKAQLGLDSDELTDAQQDLARATGDERNSIQQELAAHQAAMKEAESKSKKETETAVTAAGQYGSVAKRIAAWLSQNTRARLLEEATKQASAEAAALMAKHNNMEAHQQARTNGAAIEPSDKVTKLARLKRRAEASQMMTIYDDRIQTEQQLAAVYGKWSAQVQLQHRIVFHLLMQSFALMAGVLICMLLLNVLVRYLLQRPGVDRRRAETLRVILRVGIQFVGAVALLVIIFGVPSEMPAILGLTTAGLTVVLQDFIIAFFGWVVLMGKNGIHIGDWVEINGVGGEVVEVGLFRTALLETGNWSDKGHPTGRRVTFLNSFAIKGQYFNFSTAGQWMWDQITVTVPAADDAYTTIEQICKAVMTETEAEAKQAEEEWKRASEKGGLNHFTGGLSVEMRPSGTGIDMVVHYVTRASDRFEVRNKLYQAIIGLLHKPLGEAGSISLPVSSEPLNSK